MSRLTARTSARALAAAYAVAGAANCVAVARRSTGAQRATKPLLMPLLAGFALAAAGQRRRELRVPAAALAMSGLGDVALLGSDSWFLPGMGAFAAAHACYLTALTRDGAVRGVRRPVAAGYAAVWAGLLAVLMRRLDAGLRVPVAAYSLLLVATALLASGRNREAAAGGALFLASDALIACGLAGIELFPRQDAAVMPTYLAGQALLAAGFLRPAGPPPTAA